MSAYQLNQKTGSANCRFARLKIVSRLLAVTSMPPIRSRLIKEPIFKGPAASSGQLFQSRKTRSGSNRRARQNPGAACSRTDSR